MNKEEYKEQLLDSRWNKKRTAIIKRDNYKCTVCNSTESLHVHHTYYKKGLKAWQYPNISLITLCNICHHKWHDEHELEFRDNKKNRKKKKISSNKNEYWQGNTPYDKDKYLTKKDIRIIEIQRYKEKLHNKLLKKRSIKK